MPIGNMFPQLTQPGTEIAEAPKEFTAIRAKILEGKQRDRELAIHQQASDRAQALLPFMIQQYKDTHEGKITENAKDHLEFQITKHFYDEGMKGNGTMPGATAQKPQPSQMPVPQESLPQLEQKPQQNLVQPGTQIPGTPSLADIMQNFMPGRMPQRQPIQGMQEQLQQQINPGLNFQPSPVLQPQPEPAPQEQPAPQEAPGPKTLPTGEVEIAPGNPNLYFADKMAGHIKSIPAPQVHFGKDGMIYTRYPSGRTTVINAGAATGAGGEPGMSPEDVKEANREKLAEYKDTLTEQKENRKEARDIRTKAFPIEHILHDVDVIRNIYAKYKTKTGPGAAFGRKLGLLDKKDLGALTTAFGDLQASVAHNASSKAGIALFNWAGKVKPDTFNPANFNLGMVDSLEDAALYDYSGMNRDHKRLVKENLPAYNERVKKYEEGNKGGIKTITVITSDGQEQEIDEDKFNEAKAIDPGVRRK